MRSGDRRQLRLARIGNVKIEEMVRRRLLSKAHAVGKELDLREIGVDGDLCHILHAVDIALAAQMDKGIIRKPGLVGIEGVLLILAVDGDQALVVLSVLAALRARVRAEVEHIPHMRRPEILTGKELADQGFMIHRLILLGIIAAFRLGIVPVERLAAVLAHADGRIGIFLMEAVKPRTVFIHAAAVPAEVMIVADHVRNMHDFLIHTAHGDAGDHRGARGVQPMHQIVELSVIADHVRILRAVHGDLVGEAPDRNGRMVIALHDELLHLQSGILVGVRHMAGDIRDLRPDDHAALVAQVIEVLVVLIVRQPDRVRADLANQVHVLPVMLRQQRVADLPAVLMAGDAAQRILAPVEDEASLRVDGEAAAAKARRHPVQLVSMAQNRRLGGIQIRILHAIPQVRAGEEKLTLVFLLRHEHAVRIQDAVANLIALLQIDRKALNGDLGIRAVHHRRDMQAGAAVGLQIKVRIRHGDDVHIAVQTAVEGEVCRLRIDILVGCIVHEDHQRVFLAQRGRDFHPPGRVAAVMMRQAFAVHVHIGGGIGAVDLQIELIPCGQLALPELPGVAAGAAEIIVAAVLPVLAVPGMRQMNRLARSRQDSRRLGHPLDKHPVLIDVVYRSHDASPLRKRAPSRGRSLLITRLFSPSESRCFR